MKRKIFISIVILLSIICFSCSKTKEKVEDDVKEARKREYRSLTVTNQTLSKQISECNLTTATGVLVTHKKLEKFENIVFKNFDEGNAFENESDFKIELIDRYGLKFAKTFTANPKGNTDVVVTEEDYVEQPGDWKRRLERKINQ